MNKKSIIILIVGLLFFSCIILRTEVQEQNLYGAAREEDMVTVNYEMAERTLEWL